MHPTQAALRATAAAALTLAAWPSSAQTPPALANPPLADTALADTQDALQAMSDAAGLIFTGTVTAIRRPAAPDGNPGGIVEIDFVVTDAIRGISSPTYTLREWAGLWAAGDQPLRAGLRYLMLLHAPNAAGLTAPVDGTDGAIPIRGTGPAATPDGPDTATQTGTTAPALAQTMDLGWVATHVATPIVYASPHTVLADPITVHASARAGEESHAAPADPPPAAAPPTRATPYASVIGALRTWEAARATRP